MPAKDEVVSIIVLTRVPLGRLRTLVEWILSYSMVMLIAVSAVFLA